MTRTDARPVELAAPEDLLLPDLADLAGPDGAVEVLQRTLTDRYLDTADGALAAAGASLRRRSGPEGAGWLLRLAPGTTPAELTSSSTARTPPAGLTRVALGLTRGQELQPVADLSTQQTSTRLVGPDGRPRAEVVDERTSSTTLGHESRLDHWRTLVVRGGDEDTDLAPVVARLEDAGARPDDGPSPLERALGSAAPTAATAETSSLAGLVGRYVAEQCDQIARGDLALRLGDPKVHRTRVAIRRLRSTLRVYGDLLDPEPARRLEEELVWWSGLLGEVRDREVLAARLAAQLAALPPELVLGPVAADLDATLSRERAQHLHRVEEELIGARLLGLLEALVRWRTEPPFLEGASAPADGVRAYVKAAGRNARRRLRQAAREEPGPEQEERLHRARKAAKRARYAAELAEPAWPRAAQHARRAEELQTQLGEHQDSVVTAAFLLRAGAAAGARRGHNGFTYGLLLADERQRATEVRRRVRSLRG
ncbi:CHAD domain-containing protein [Friedmanniella luteola]|uniref:CHAD domain-containing protein n=1 Tax=Friedmanniella luteola TaxID=546871 RepID=A0A1H1QT08_9ACTN|nr:CHAD domain-containing protein [Friedmanniella luteola]SDS26611.1 CHAD domain-containing protein [Friedmanniella luteola]